MSVDDSGTNAYGHSASPTLAQSDTLTDKSTATEPAATELHTHTQRERERERERESSPESWVAKNRQGDPLSLSQENNFRTSRQNSPSDPDNSSSNITPKSQSHKSTNPRDSRFEILRIAAMGLIVLSHSLGISFDLIYPSGTLPPLIGAIAQYTGSIGNMLFFMISGYFAARNGIKVSRLLKVFIPLWFWGVVFFLLHPMVADFYPLTTPIQFIWYFLTGNLGFVIGYALIQFLGAFIIQPFKKLRIRIQILVIVALFLLSTILLIVFYQQVLTLPPTFELILSPLLTYGIAYLWIFLLGAVLEQNPLRVKPNLIIFGIISMTIIASYLASNTSDPSPFSKYIAPSAARLTAFLIFLLTLHVKPFHSQKINNFSKLMFGVYIVHNNALSPVAILILGEGLPFTLFISLFPSLAFTLPVLIPLTVFVMCALLESLRQLLFHRLKLLTHLNSS